MARNTCILYIVFVVVYSSNTNYVGTPGMKLFHLQYLLIIFVCFLVKPQLVVGMSAGLIGLCLLLVVLKRRRKGIICWNNHFSFSLSLKWFNANFFNCSETIETSSIYFSIFFIVNFFKLMMFIRSIASLKKNSLEFFYLRWWLLTLLDILGRWRTFFANLHNETKTFNNMRNLYNFKIWSNCCKRRTSGICNWLRGRIQNIVKQLGWTVLRK